jgi:hypothetical protein
VWILHEFGSWLREAADLARGQVRVNPARSSFHGEFRFTSFHGFHPPAHSWFYETQELVIAEIIALARASCMRWKAALGLHGTLSLDATWSHARRARQCFGCFIALGDNPKIMDFETYEF